LSIQKHQLSNSMQPLTYHIHYRPKGQRSSDVHSITPRLQDDETGEDMGFASGSFVRKLWLDMVNVANRTGSMRHPDTGQILEFASLHYAGRVDSQGNGNGGMLCQRWTVNNGLEKIFEPEPELYIPKIVRDEPVARETIAPEQPPPPGPQEDVNVTGLDKYAPSPEEIPAAKPTRQKRVKEPKRADAVSVE
jgi:hypothetical protein